MFSKWIRSMAASKIKIIYFTEEKFQNSPVINFTVVGSNPRNCRGEGDILQSGNYAHSQLAAVNDDTRARHV